MSQERIYKAAVYARLSKEDGNGTESNSIGNQVNFLSDYIGKQTDIELVSVRKDDGYSGVDFNRPDFQLMMEDAKKGKIDCIIVKDFSRLGRNHLEVAEYMQHVFPFLGLRFISVNDGYDSIQPNEDSDHIIVPFKNLINESYLRDISIKIRSSLDSKRQNGEFVANFAPYGYVRDPEDKHRMTVDPYAAGIVRKIFSYKLNGMSHEAIANELNQQGEPTPLDYKNMNGLPAFTPLKKYQVSSWGFKMIDRILRNRVYIGILEQGKVTTPSYKVKKRIEKPREEWAVKEDAHPAIISQFDFEIVQNLLEIGAHAGPGETEVSLWAGLLYCGDCHSNMIHKIIPANGKRYQYYICANNKYHKECSSHSISVGKLENAVFHAIKSQIKTVVEIEKYIQALQNKPDISPMSVYVVQQVQLRKKDLESVQNMRRILYEDYREGIVSKEDFLLFNSEYLDKAEKLKSGIVQLEKQVDILQNNVEERKELLLQYLKFEKETKLTRRMLVSLVKKIDIYEGKRISIEFFYQDKLQMLAEIMASQEDVKG